MAATIPAGRTGSTETNMLMLAFLWTGSLAIPRSGFRPYGAGTVTREHE